MKEFLRGIAFSLSSSLLLCLAACTNPDALPVALHSSSEAPLPHADRSVLRIAIAPLTSPRDSFPLFAQLQSYLAARLHQPVGIIYRSTYTEVNALLRAGECDIAFVSGYPYVQGKHDFGMEALAAPVVGGQDASYSYIIVPASSSRTSLSELRGSVFAFSDPLSNAGRLAPEFAVSRPAGGTRAQTFFRRVVFTYGQERSIEAVTARTVDGAAVDSLVFERMAAADPSLRVAVRVIERLGPFGTPLVVVRPALDAAVKDDIRRVFLHMHEDPNGRRVLRQLGFDRFAPPDDRSYDGIRRMAQLLEGRP